jgi:hypothetical protein
VLTLPVGGSLPSMFTAGVIYWVFARTAQVDRPKAEGF